MLPLPPWHIEVPVVKGPASLIVTVVEEVEMHPL